MRAKIEKGAGDISSADWDNGVRDEDVRVLLDMINVQDKADAALKKGVALLDVIQDTMCTYLAKMEENMHYAEKLEQAIKGDGFSGDFAEGLFLEALENSVGL